MYWSAVKGICIICVIIIHITLPEANGRILFPWFVLRRLTAFPVAVFFTLAGYFVHLEKVRSHTYLTEKINRVLIPYILFTTLYILRNCTETAANWKGIVMNYLLGSAEIQLYYLLYLMQMIILLPFIYKVIVESKHRMFFMAAILALSCIWSYLRIYLQILPLFCSFFCFSFLFYYCLGVFIKAYTEGRIEKNILIEKISKQSDICIFMILFMAFIVSMSEAFSQRLISQITLGNYVYAIVLIGFIFLMRTRAKNVKFPNILVWIGNNSFAIYLIHMFILRWIWDYMPQLSFPIQQISELVITLGGSMILIWVVKRLFGERKWLKAIGF
jgi:fucose 4-O-acetylase-like acetyltransferase